MATAAKTLIGTYELDRAHSSEQRKVLIDDTRPELFARGGPCGLHIISVEHDVLERLHQ